MTDESVQVEADRIDTEEAEAAQQEAESRTEFIEFLGDPNNAHGVAFLTAHTLPRGDGLWKRAGLTVNKDVTWERDPQGPPIGHKGARFLLPVSDLPEGVAEVLERTPGYKRVSE